MSQGLDWAVEGGLKGCVGLARLHPGSSDTRYPLIEKT